METKPDISAIIIYTFCERVYYKHINQKFPHEVRENLGRFVGVADNVGHALTYKILTDDSEIIFRSQIRTTENTTVKNKILEPITDEEILKLKLKRATTLPIVDPDELIGRTFLKEPNDDGIRLRAK